MDYPIVNQTLIYRQGGPDPCFNISPISDSRFESATERFRLRMRSSSPLVVVSDTAIVTITDTDSKRNLANKQLLAESWHNFRHTPITGYCIAKK